MWTAQTYLGAHVAAARYFIYLLSEDYIPEQRDFQEAVIENLRMLGIRTGSDSAIFLPDDCAKDFIKMELFDVFRREMMEKIFRKTPGLLFTDKNLGVLNPARDRWVYLSLEPYIENRASQRLPKFFRRMEETIKASDDLLKDISGSRWRSIWEVMKDTVMLEPNFSGVGVDLKAARSRFLVLANIN
ncbi:hypothetical protein [Almyronema epifaneia]|uniref:Uncharacterized protein n=1 Tax=Almyronema epifaneia S1 TaxID=2991925 RepID=A0ABW6ICA2_9CYAN